MVRTVLVASLAAVAACSQPGVAPGSESGKAPPPAAAPSAPAASPLTPEGLGPIRIGMTDAEARAAVGGANIEIDTGTELSQTCTEIKLKGAYPGVYLMIEEGRLTRITATDDAAVRTDKGIGVGASAAQVTAAYPGAVAEPHKYEEAPAQYLTVWTVPGKEGTVFEVNGRGVVGSIHAGTDSITYVEGCA